MQHDHVCEGVKTAYGQKLMHNFRSRDFYIQFSYKYCHQPFSLHVRVHERVLAAYWLGPLENSRSHRLHFILIHVARESVGFWKIKVEAVLCCVLVVG